MGYPDLVVVQNMAFPKLGLPIAVVEDFIQTCGGEAAFLNANGSHMTTADALRAFVLPETATTKLSFCEQLRFTDARVRDATVFISHAWRFSFVEFFKALKKHFQNSDAVLWIDIFSNNQHEASDHEFEWWSTTFKDAIDHFGNVVMVLSPWENPIPFTRAWCLFEIFSATVTNAKFDVAMTQEQETKFAQALLEDHQPYFELLAKIDLRDSDAAYEEDKCQIFTVVEKSCGFQRLNHLVCEYIRSWVLRVVNELVNLADNPASRRQALLTKASILLDQNKPLEAKKILEDLLLESTGILGENSAFVGSVHHALSRSADGLRDYSTAVEQAWKAIRVREQHKNARPLELAESLCHISFMYILRGCFDLEGEERKKANASSLECASKAMTLKVAAVGAGHRLLSKTHNNLGNALYRAGREDEAMANYNAQLEILKEHDAMQHPEAASCYYMIGMLWGSKSLNCEPHRREQRLEFGKKAAEYYEKCITIRAFKLGEGHHSVATACRNVASVYRDCCENFEKAAESCQRSLDSTLASSLGRKSPHLPPAVAKLAAALKELCDKQRDDQPEEAYAAYSRGRALCQEFKLEGEIAVYFCGQADNCSKKALRNVDRDFAAAVVVPFSVAVAAAAAYVIYRLNRHSRSSSAK